MARFRAIRLTLGVAAGLASACSGDSGPGPAPVPVRLGIAVEPSAAASSGALLSIQPVVQALDASGDPIASRGLLVTVSLASGGGTVTGGSGVRTDAEGRAAFTDLVLAGPVGPRTLRFSSTGLSSVISREITLGPGSATTAQITAGNNQTVPAGTDVPVRPAVRVVDPSNNPVPGAQVTFSVTQGGGVIEGGEVTTNASGLAEVGRWTLGTVIGQNALSVSVAGVTPSLTITATGVVGPPATLAMVEGDGQTATIGTAVAIAPAVKVTDAFGNVVAGVSVTFTVSTGGGTAAPGSAIADAGGVARLGSWRLGLDPGVNTLTASRQGAVSAVFSATGIDFAVTSLATGTAHTCGATADGLRCWGVNSSGQFGNGGTGSDSLPTPAAGALAFAQVAAGANHTCGLTAAGTAWCWGNNSLGQLGDGTSTARITPVQVTGGYAFKQLVAGASHTCGLRIDGAVFCWGAGANGRLGYGGTLNSTNPVAAAGSFTYTAVSAGSAHTCAVRNDGVVLCWGANTNGRLGDGSTTDRAIPTAVSGGGAYAAVAAGGSHSCALTTAGAAFCWGNGANGQLGIGTTPTQVTVPTAATGTTTYASIVAGTSHTCALAPNGSASCWGANGSGRLGDGTTVQRLEPVAVSGGVSFAALAAGGEHTCGRSLAGSAICWGRNAEGQLGDGTTALRTTPVGVRRP
jgi:alpha-tubulin suppressor-like RCC1 family protein